MLKTCRICGKVFEANNPRFCTCSPACSKKNNVIMQKKNYLAHRSEYNQKRRASQQESYRQRFVPCLICGKNIEPTFNGERYTRKRYHEACVVKEALKAIKEGKGRKDKAIMRAWNTYAYTDKELREMLKSETYL